MRPDKLLHGIDINIQSTVKLGTRFIKHRLNMQRLSVNFNGHIRIWRNIAADNRVVKPQFV